MKKARQQVVKDERKEQYEHLSELIGWWVERMRESQDPLAEKMTLFWHGHFATSAIKVKDAYLMWRQNQTFRDNARGNFGVLVKAVSRDPAMIDWLDLKESKAAHPNENFAREVMELFTLGEGHLHGKRRDRRARAPLPATASTAARRELPFPTAPARQHAEDVCSGATTSSTATRPSMHDHSPKPACARFISPASSGRSSPTRTRSDALVEALAATMRATPLRDAPGAAPDVHEHRNFIRPQSVREPDQEPGPVARADRAGTGELRCPAARRRCRRCACKQMGQVPFNPHQASRAGTGARRGSARPRCSRAITWPATLLGTMPTPVHTRRSRARRGWHGNRPRGRSWPRPCRRWRTGKVPDVQQAGSGQPCAPTRWRW